MRRKDPIQRQRAGASPDPVRLGAVRWSDPALAPPRLGVVRWSVPALAPPVSGPYEGLTLPWHRPDPRLAGNKTGAMVSNRCRSLARCHVTGHAIHREEPRPSPARRASGRGLVLLGWVQFWLLSGILGTLLALFIVILLVHLSSL